MTAKWRRTKLKLCRKIPLILAGLFQKYGHRLICGFQLNSTSKFANQAPFASNCGGKDRVPPPWCLQAEHKPCTPPLGLQSRERGGFELATSAQQLKIDRFADVT